MGEKRMRSKWIIRIWLGRLTRYLVVPLVFCVILFPLYGLMHQQTEKAQLTDAAEQLATAVSTFEGYLSDLRFTTNKLFNDDSYKLLAVSDDDSLMGDYMTSFNASTLLQDLTYSMSYTAYSYVTFARNHFVIDPYRVFSGYESFYPGALEYRDVPQDTWAAWQDARETLYLPAQSVVLNRTNYPDSYLTITQPFINSGGQFRGACNILIRERTLSNLFLPTEKWRNDGLFYLVRDDGTLLSQYRCNGAALSFSGNETGIEWYDGQKYLFVSRSIPSLGASAVIGLPYSVYAENLRAVNRAIWFYIGAGLLGCFLLSSAMTLWELRQLKPILDTLDDAETANTRLFNDLLVQKLRNHSQLSAELERARGELDHSRVEAFLKTGAAGTAEEQKKMCEQMHLTDYNYLLLIPAQERQTETHVGEELRLMMIAEQVRQSYGRTQFVYNTTEGSVLVVLTLDKGTEAEQVQMCRQTEALHGLLEMTEPLILSGRFTRLEQLSSVYWQARNMAAYSDRTQKVCYTDEGNGMSDMALHMKTLEIEFSLYLPSLTDMQKAILKQTIIELYNQFGIFWETDIRQLKATDFPILSDLHALLEKKAEANKENLVYLSGESLVRVTTTDITSLERLNEYLLSGRAQEAQSLIGELFHVDDLSPQNFQQAFFSVRGVLIAAAQKVECEDIAYLCSYDNRQSARRQVQNLRDCCFEICSHVDSLKRSHNEALQRRVLAWLNEQYTRPDLNIAMAAEQFHISKKYVTQFLKDQTGKSFTEYVEELRLSRAMELLRGSELGITEISVQCGFSTQNTFYKAFRRRFGISPSAVRRGDNAG